MIRVDLYSKPDCSLCEKAAETLRRLQKRLPFLLNEQNLEDGSEMEKLHRTEIPVIYIDSVFFSRHSVDKTAFIGRIRELLEET